MLAAIHRVGVDIRPEAMGLTWETASAVARGDTAEVVITSLSVDGVVNGSGKKTQKFLWFPAVFAGSFGHPSALLCSTASSRRPTRDSLAVSAHPGARFPNRRCEFTLI